MSTTEPPSSGRQPSGAEPSLRPARVTPVPLSALAELIGAPAQDFGTVLLTGVSLDSRAVEPADLYLALPGASTHGAQYAGQAVAAGAVAIVTDDDGARLLHDLPELAGVPVLVVPSPRGVVGTAAAFVYGTGHAGLDGPPSEGPSAAAMELYAVTGTNGKTTTTYFINSLLRALDFTPGLIGTIEILAGAGAVPSRLTTPESTDVHALLALMRERGLDAASMEVSSHALSFHRVDGVQFDIAGFTNLTQDHLDLHGTMEEYFATKAKLFGPHRARRAVITVDDSWGQRLAREAAIPVTTLRTVEVSTAEVGQSREAVEQSNGPEQSDWQVRQVEKRGLGSSFILAAADGRTLRVSTGLPGSFNIANAALAVVMVLQLQEARGESAVLKRVQAALDSHDPFTLAVPGRMQLVGKSPTAIVDFAHNPDALERALVAVRSSEPESKVIVVFGATGQRDAGKRPKMGAVVARLADVVIITDDDPHDEDAASIRADVLQGARNANDEQAFGHEILEIFPRADAIVRAVELAGPQDVILVAGRGHEVWQEVKGVNHSLDDRAELRAALRRCGFTPEPVPGIES
ncbi:UDP-N-acetylmuramoyl-L-alanyl-D-glutamate--2,6-diaminopimelate ligase [Paeniglutamicibacter antarcticus]|uniref:UDP-N-acetylmuramyl-tripeptide synthetase n=1 Tax=Arthrobacter terrae TaxID=2935737 RepID=A0A931CUX6_9MICC|nr:UDP-N-acetylmuramoyl-L-alanyl-D-glutamate--2,6-diaminopimelate ligase [Arthrobacter terrae]MBG0741414.1 UDP-N-acetylmuramoyl-L-alanyl-D-glutamate--2,6-diaminopimelate ligase [Arthrobacter terrae]